MTADLTLRLGEIGADLAKRAPRILYTVVVALESLRRELDATRPERYQVGPPIGAGGTAEVLLGVTRGAHGFQRLVAIKRARADHASSRAFESMLIEEALQAARLSHDNVIAALDFECDAEGRCYLVMEYIDGLDLRALIATGPIPISVSIFIVSELLVGLGYLHRSQDFGHGRVGGLVHRDVKPANVLLSWQGAVKLGDLGLALMFEQGGTVEARGREGTLWYMSPEQSRRAGLDGRSDLYAAGVVLWELLSRHRLRPEPVGASMAGSSQPIPHPSEYQPAIPTDVEAVVLRLLADAPEERYPTAELAAHDLLLCQAAPRDGRGELVRLLDERFPPRERQRALARLVHPQEPDGPRPGPRTATAPPAVNEAPIMLGLLDASKSDEGEGEQRPARWRLLRARVLWWFVVVLVAEAAALPVLIVVE